MGFSGFFLSESGFSGLKDVQDLFNSSVFVCVYQRLSAFNKSKNLILCSYILIWYKEY
jgi:hypothetical protein